MQSDHSSIHHTEINRIQNAEEGGWEFVCHSCGYRARYTINQQGVQKLEILFAGDSTARHATGIPPETVQDDPTVLADLDQEEDGELASFNYSQIPPDDDGMSPDDLAEDVWIPVEIQEQIEVILRDYLL